MKALKKQQNNKTKEAQARAGSELAADTENG